jgi:hypothetical protein
VLAALQLAGRAVGALRAAAGSDVAAQASDLQALAQALEIALQKLGLGDPTRLPAALDPMFTFDVTLVAAITVSAPMNKMPGKRSRGRLRPAALSWGTGPTARRFCPRCTRMTGDGTSGLAYMVEGAAKPLAGAATQEPAHV